MDIKDVINGAISSVIEENDHRANELDDRKQNFNATAEDLDARKGAVRPYHTNIEGDRTRLRYNGKNEKNDEPGVGEKIVNYVKNKAGDAGDAIKAHPYIAAATAAGLAAAAGGLAMSKKIKGAIKKK